MASLVKKRNRYYARIIYKIGDTRKEKTIPLKTDNETKALRRIKRIKELETLFKRGDIAIKDLVMVDIPDIEELIAEFLEFKKLQKISDKTESIYNYALNAFKIILNGSDLRLLTKTGYLPMMRALIKKYPNPNTLNMYIRAINTFLNWAVKFDNIPKLPFTLDQVRMNKRRPRYFSNAEMKVIYEKLSGNSELSNRVRLHVETGMRLRELYTSYLGDNTIHVYSSKGGTERTIPVTDEIAEIYNDCKQGTHIDGTLSKMFKNVLIDAGLYYLPSRDKRCFHCLRHTYAVKEYYRTRDIYRVCKLLGHSDVKTTQIYAQFDNVQLEKDFGPGKS